MKEDIILKQFSELDSNLKKIWLKFQKNSYHYYFQSLEFVDEYIKAKNLKKNIRPLIIVVYKKAVQEPICIIPLEVSSVFGITTISWLGHNKLDYGSPILSKNENYFKDQNIMNIILNKIKIEIQKFDLIYFNNQPEFIEDVENPFTKYLECEEKSQNFYIELPANNENYLNIIKQRNKKIHRDILRLKRKLEKENNVFFYNLKPSEFQKSIDQIFLKKNILLNAKKKKSNLDEKFLNFLKNLSSINSQNFVINIMKINNEVVQKSISFNYQGTFYYFITSEINYKFRKYSQGKIFILYLINWCIKNKMKKFDFCLGDEVYKNFFSNKNQKLYRYIGSNSLKGHLIKKCLEFIIFFKKFF